MGGIVNLEIPGSHEPAEVLKAYVDNVGLMLAGGGASKIAENLISLGVQSTEEYLAEINDTHKTYDDPGEYFQDGIAMFEKALQPDINGHVAFQEATLNGLAEQKALLKAWNEGEVATVKNYFTAEKEEVTEQVAKSLMRVKEGDLVEFYAKWGLRNAKNFENTQRLIAVVEAKQAG